MKKLGFLIFVLCIISVAVYFLVFSIQENKSGFEGTPLESLNAGESAPVPADMLQPYFNAYFGLKDALVSSDAEAANAAAENLIAAGKAIYFTPFQLDEAISGNISHYINTVESNSMALIQENSLDDKRKEFEIISDAFWSLGQITKYNGEKVFYQYCPMAFDNKGAYWLSNSREILNPYFGDKMLKCGSVKDSLSY